MLRTAARSVSSTARRYSTAPPVKTPSKSNAGLYFGVAGVLGLGTYVYLDRTGVWDKQVEPKIAQTMSPLDPKNFKDFELKRVERYNHNTSKFVFALPDGQASLLPVASCVVIKASDTEGSKALTDDKGKPVIRPYTPISPSDLEGEFTFLIKKYDAGLASKYVHEMKPGDKLAIKGPIPKSPYKVNEFDEVALIGGGSGITPLYQILDHALADKSNKTKFKLIFSNVTEQDILLREEIEAWKKKYPDTFDYVFVLDNPEKGWTGETGRVTKEILQKHVAPATLKEKVKVYICGPPPQVAAIAGKKDGMKQGAVGGVLKELGYTEDQVFKF